MSDDRVRLTEAERRTLVAAAHDGDVTGSGCSCDAVCEATADIVTARLDRLRARLADTEFKLRAAMSALAAIREVHDRKAAGCPICGVVDGFHDEATHAARELPEGKALPVEDAIPACRACGEPINKPGDPACRYPKHEAER